ncbi:hypothetical protein CRUP_027999, partial [Coryphaenoides rupestris]
MNTAASILLPPCGSSPFPRGESSIRERGRCGRCRGRSSQIKSLLQQMGPGQETPELQDRLQQLQHYTNQLAKETNRHLKELGSFSLPLSPSEQ